MKSRARFGIALALAAVLGAWLIWTSIGGSLETYTSPSTLASADGTTYRLNGIVASAPADAAVRAQEVQGVRFVVRDKKDAARTVPVSYRGSVPDTFKVGREVVVTGRVENGVFMARRGSLITLCPSKFLEKKPGAAKPAPGARPGSQET